MFRNNYIHDTPNLKNNTGQILNPTFLNFKNKNYNNSIPIITSQYSCLSIDDDYHNSIDNHNHNICHTDIYHFGSYTFGVGFHNMVGIKWSDIYT